MPNFCSHCGAEVTDPTSKFCSASGKPLSQELGAAPSKQTTNDAKASFSDLVGKIKDATQKVSADLKSEDTQAKLKSFAEQAKTFATEKTKDLKEELGKINEARKETAMEASSLESRSNVEKTKVLASSFWSKLTSNQKIILVGMITLFIAVLMAMTGDGMEADARKEFKLNCKALSLEEKFSTFAEIEARTKPATEWSEKMTKKYSSPEDRRKYNEAFVKAKKSGCGFKSGADW